MVRISMCSSDARKRLLRYIYANYEAYKNYTYALPLELQLKYKKNLNLGKRREIKQISPDLFTVAPQSGQNKQYRSQRIVNLASRSCSCGEFDNTIFPCLHAAVAIHTAKLDFREYIHPAYSIEELRLAHSNFLTLVDLESVVDDSKTIPSPITHSKRGRPKQRRIRSTGEVNQQSMNSCNACGEKGHNIKTCQLKPASKGKINKGKNKCDESQLKRTVNCSECGQSGYNKATCGKRKAVEDTIPGNSKGLRNT